MRINRRDDRSRHSKNSYERQARPRDERPYYRKQLAEAKRNGEDLDYDAEEGHAGRGPRGYQRPDERIAEEVNEALTRHGAIDASDIEVHATSGEVTLSGSTQNRRAKRLAEDLAHDVSGVKDVTNHLRVRSDARAGAGPAGGDLS